MDNNASDLKPKVVLGVAAHPDDLDFGCSGLVAKWASEGAEIHYLIVTNGSKGSDDEHMTSDQLIKLRRTEQKDAAKVLGVKTVVFFDYDDGELEVTKQLKKDIVRQIRKFKPDTVITLDPTFVYSVKMGFINHTDHRAVGQATLDAIYPLARDRLTFPELLEEGYEPHKVKHVLLMSFVEGNYLADITNHLDTKILALKAHKSQVGDFKQVESRIKEFAKLLGEQNGCEYAEGFNRIDMFI